MVGLEATLSCALRVRAPVVCFLNLALVSTLALADSPSWSGASRIWECVPTVIRDDGFDEFYLVVDAGAQVQSVVLDGVSPFLTLPAACPIAFRNDGQGADVAAGDSIWVAGPFRWRADAVAVQRFWADAASPDGLDIVDVGTIRVQDATGSSSFLVNPSIGVVRSSTHPPPFQTNSSHVLRAPHLVNVRTTGRHTQAWLRGLGGDIPLLTQTIYTVLPDTTHFFALLSTCHVEQVPPESPRNFINGRHLAVRRDFAGMGHTPFDDTSGYGSEGTLLGMVALDCGKRGLYSANLVHELLHQWTPAPGLGLVDDQGHYPARSSTASLLGGFLWPTGSGGAARIDCLEGRNGATRAGFMDRYMAGLIREDQVPAIHIYNATTASPESLCGQSPPNPIQSVDLSSITAQFGPRVPGPEAGPRHYNLFFVVETHDRWLTPAELAFYERLAQHFTSPVVPGTTPYVGFNWAPISAFFGDGVTWNSAAPCSYDSDGDGHIDQYADDRTPPELSSVPEHLLAYPAPSLSAAPIELPEIAVVDNCGVAAPGRPTVRIFQPGVDPDQPDAPAEEWPDTRGSPDFPAHVWEGGFRDFPCSNAGPYTVRAEAIDNSGNPVHADVAVSVPCYHLLQLQLQTSPVQRAVDRCVEIQLCGSTRHKIDELMTFSAKRREFIPGQTYWESRVWQDPVKETDRVYEVPIGAYDLVTARAKFHSVTRASLPAAAVLSGRTAITRTDRSVVSVELPQTGVLVASFLASPLQAPADRRWLVLGNVDGRDADLRDFIDIADFAHFVIQYQDPDAMCSLNGMLIQCDLSPDVPLEDGSVFSVPRCLDGDFDGNGFLDGNDLSMLLSNFLVVGDPFCPPAPGLQPGGSGGGPGQRTGLRTLTANELGGAGRFSATGQPIPESPFTAAGDRINRQTAGPGSGGGSAGPRQSMTVAELKAMGIERAELADTNGDGVVDVQDMGDRAY